MVIDHHTQLALDDVLFFSSEEVTELKNGEQVYTSSSFFSTQFGQSLPLHHQRSAEQACVCRSPGNYR